MVCIFILFCYMRPKGNGSSESAYVTIYHGVLMISVAVGDY